MGTATKRQKTQSEMKWQFKEDHTFDQRCAESQKIRQKYPDRIPVIVQKVENSNIEKIDKRKYLVPADITAAQFMWIIRKRINLPSERAIFLFVDKMCHSQVGQWANCTNNTKTRMVSFTLPTQGRTPLDTKNNKTFASFIRQIQSRNFILPMFFSLHLTSLFHMSN